MKRIFQTWLVLLLSMQFTYGQSNSLKATDKPVSIVLSDKSKVWVNHAGTVSYPSIFDNKQSWIEVEGEAYVEIHSTKLKQIRAGELIINALPGARVNINAFANDSAVTITVLKGPITIKKENKTYHLKTGEQFLVDKSNPGVSIQKADTSGMSWWK